MFTFKNINQRELKVQNIWDYIQQALMFADAKFYTTIEEEAAIENKIITQDGRPFYYLK